MFDSVTRRLYAAVNPWEAISRTLEESMLRRNVILGAGTVAGAASLAACGGPAGGGSQSVALDKQPPTKLEFWGGPPTAGTRNDRQDQIDFWNNKFPNVQVEFSMAQ